MGLNSTLQVKPNLMCKIDGVPIKASVQVRLMCTCCPAEPYEQLKQLASAILCVSLLLTVLLFVCVFCSFLASFCVDCEQGLCRPQLSVITGRGNHSQGGVARIRPAVIDYLTNKHYRYTHTRTHTQTWIKFFWSPTSSPVSLSHRFTEPKPGFVLVSLK